MFFSIDKRSSLSVLSVSDEEVKFCDIVNRRQEGSRFVGGLLSKSDRGSIRNQKRTESISQRESSTRDNEAFCQRRCGCHVGVDDDDVADEENSIKILDTSKEKFAANGLVKIRCQML